MVGYFSNLRLLIIRHGNKSRSLSCLSIKDVNISGSLSCLSNELRYVEWEDYPFMYLPSSFQPIQLVELILKHSSIKYLWKDKKYLPKLRKLWLPESRNLIEMPNFDDFPNLEQLDLEGCESLVKLDPSIGLLSKLVYLNLKGCSSLKSISNTIFGLSSLEYLYMSGCSKVSFNNPRASSIQLFGRTIVPFTAPPVQVEWLYCMSSIDISFCGLHQLPDAIGCLHQLQSLNLEGNYFVSLLNLNLNELSKLVYLNLDHCVFLESLPQLPFPTAINWDPFKIGLYIFNCPKLNERECRIAFSWLIQFIRANPQFSDVIDIVFPGSEIPSWFNNQSEGDRILIDYSPIKHDINNDIIGLVCCSVFSIEPSEQPISPYPGTTALKIELHLTGFYLGGKVAMSYWPEPYHHNTILLSFERNLINCKTNHIWLTYFPRKLSWYVRDFHGTMIVKFGNFQPRVNNKVKNCGYGWLHRKGLQEFNLTTMHSVDSLALKFKSLTIQDEASPQLHSFI
ncbi:hypothetical protein P8452_31671 [Trifolium repens]|nr:hypothetical protein P8452_31671 [Trifolium repens]